MRYRCDAGRNFTFQRSSERSRGGIARGDARPRRPTSMYRLIAARVIPAHTCMSVSRGIGGAEGRKQGRQDALPGVIPTVKGSGVA